MRPVTPVSTLADSMKTLPFSESHQANFIGKSIALWLFNIDMEAMDMVIFYGYFKQPDGR